MVFRKGQKGSPGGELSAKLTEGWVVRWLEFSYYIGKSKLLVATPPTRLCRATSPQRGGLGEEKWRQFAGTAAIISFYLPGLKESFRLTERLKTRWPGAQSRLSGQK